MASLNSHGLEPQEEAIMDLWDQALSVREIAARLGIGERRVQTVADNFDATCRSDRWHLHARAATAQLGMALAKAMAA